MVSEYFGCAWQEFGCAWQELDWRVGIGAVVVDIAFAVGGGGGFDSSGSELARLGRCPRLLVVCFFLFKKILDNLFGNSFDIWPKSIAFCTVVNVLIVNANSVVCTSDIAAFQAFMHVK